MARLVIDEASLQKTGELTRRGYIGTVQKVDELRNRLTVSFYIDTTKGNTQPIPSMWSKCGQVTQEVNPDDVVNVTRVGADTIRKLEKEIKDLSECVSVRNYEVHQETRKPFSSSANYLAGETKARETAEVAYLSNACIDLEACRIALNKAVQNTVDATIKVM
jgi:hypothetical protein